MTVSLSPFWQTHPDKIFRPQVTLWLMDKHTTNSTLHQTQHELKTSRKEFRGTKSKRKAQICLGGRVEGFSHRKPVSAMKSSVKKSGRFDESLLVFPSDLLTVRGSLRLEFRGFDFWGSNKVKKSNKKNGWVHPDNKQKEVIYEKKQFNSQLHFTSISTTTTHIITTSTL